MPNQKRNLRCIATYRIFSRMYFYLPILFPLFYFAKESVLHVEILFALYNLAAVIFLSLAKLTIKRIGHKLTLILGEAFKIIGLLCLLFDIKNFFVLIIAQIIMGCGYAFIVSNDTVILQQTFSFENSDAYHKAQSSTNSYMFVSLLVAGILGVIVFFYSPNLVLIFSILAAIISLFSIVIMYYQHISSSTQKLIAPKVDKMALFYYFIIRGLVLSVFVGILPYFFFILLKINLKEFAVLWAAFTLSGFISSKYLIHFVKHLSLSLVLPISAIMLLIALSLLLFKNFYLCILTTFLFGITSGFVRPLTIAKINTTIYNVEETLKKAELYYGLLSTVILLLTGIWLQFLNFNSYIILLMVLCCFYFIPFKKICNT